MDLDFRGYLEVTFGLNAPGRAGQHVWKPETPIISDPNKPKFDNNLKKIKGVNLDGGFRPGFIAPFKGLTGKDFGVKVVKSPNLDKSK